MEFQVAEHYHSDNLLHTILDALEKAGKSPDKITLKDLGPVDQLHTGGFLATMALLNASDLPENSRILDAGCGIGGSARLIAKEFNVQVSAIDLADEFITTARDLTKRCHLSDRVQYEQGSILDLPFPGNAFDAVLSQHLLMNIEDKPRAFDEFFRVLKPGGKLLIHEIFKTGDTPIDYPVPWASHKDISFLTPWDSNRSQLRQTGFAEAWTTDQSESAKIWWNKVKAAHGRKDQPVKPLGPHLIFGDDGKQFGSTMSVNFNDQRIQLIESIFTKP